MDVPLIDVIPSDFVTTMKTFIDMTETNEWSTVLLYYLKMAFGEITI